MEAVLWNALNVEYKKFHIYGRAPFQEHGGKSNLLPKYKTLA